MSDSPESEYARAVWQWLRGEIPAEPSPVTFRLDPSVAAAIRRQCEIERKRIGTGPMPADSRNT